MKRKAFVWYFSRSHSEQREIDCDRCMRNCTCVWRLEYVRADCPLHRVEVPPSDTSLSSGLATGAIGSGDAVRVATVMGLQSTSASSIAQPPKQVKHNGWSSVIPNGHNGTDAAGSGCSFSGGPLLTSGPGGACQQSTGLIQTRPKHQFAATCSSLTLPSTHESSIRYTNLQQYSNGGQSNAIGQQTINEQEMIFTEECCMQLIEVSYPSFALR